VFLILANYHFNVIIYIYEEGAITPEYWEENSLGKASRVSRTL
jgi:hypothetical protein